MAIDSIGNVIYAGALYSWSSASALSTSLKITANNAVATGAGGSYSASSLSTDQFAGVAVDQSGNIYAADQTTNQIVLFTANAGQYSSTVLAAATSPQGVAVDEDGTVYHIDVNYVDYSDWTYTLGKLIPSVNGYTKTTYAHTYTPNSNMAVPYWDGLAADFKGNLYVGQNGDNSINEVTILNSTGTENGALLCCSAGYAPWVATDSLGNVYLADEQNKQVKKYDAGDPPSLDFGRVEVAQSSAVQTVTLTNNGTGALNFSSISIPNHFRAKSEYPCPFWRCARWLFLGEKAT